ncbi:thiosulfate oxidation carrier protein SoxY [Candidatus Parabeggiatoa sp. HSG14]|uniref:thiosulfate oxidation carrier protein SoxY n=1 Tax=Candidatus Parabeggiatoa sp. HSG14 TaxID=3055593 RepID=UPI0025A75E07|nr:thiosulfate oxidation carrier protein SoxY [Thiotrichales bacterium HSG14]
MTISRRNFIRNAVALGIGTIILPPALMADRAAFQTEEFDKALGFLFTDTPIVTSDKITLKAPDIAENGKVVEIEVKTDLPNVESITILSEKNPRPLVAQFNFKGKVRGWAKTRIKMGGTGNVIVVVKADGKLYKASRQIKVTIGGCGG